jgi:hypothetical protein
VWPREAQCVNVEGVIISFGKLYCYGRPEMLRGCPCIVALELKFDIARRDTRACDLVSRGQWELAPKSFEIDIKF